MVSRLKRTVRRALKYALVYFLFLTGALHLAKWRARRRRSLAVLTLHRVLPSPEFEATSSLPGIILRDTTFAGLAAYLRNHGRVIDLVEESFSTEDRLTQARSKEARPARHSKPTFAITFDDGWADNGTIAAPILARESLPALIFLCPGLMGRALPFWPERAIAGRRRQSTLSGDELEPVCDLSGWIEQLKQTDPEQREATLSALPAPSAGELDRREPLNRTLTWEDLPALSRQRIRFGSHTYSHQILTQISPVRMADELTQSRREIETRLDMPCDTLAYPNGNHSAEIHELAGRAGYRLAFTTEHGLWNAPAGRLRIPRINISENRITGPTGRFSRALFEYHVFWPSSAV